MLQKPHRAWLVCFGCCAAMFAILGVGVNVFAVVLPYFRTEYGFTHTQVALFPTVRMCFYLVCVALSTQVCRKLTYRLCVSASVLLCGAAYLLYGWSRSLAGCYAACALVGVSYGLGSTVPTSLLLSRWFHARRGLAIGICSAGSGLATVALSPVLVGIIDRRGLQAGFVFLAAVCAVCALAAFATLRDSPEACSMKPYGEGTSMARHEASRHVLHPTHRRWAALYVCLALLCGAISVSFQFLMTLNTSQGFPAMDASLAMSVFGVALMAGKLLFGSVCDRVGSRRTNTLFGAVLLLGIVVCMSAPLHSRWLMLAGAVLLGLGAPMSTVGLSLWATDFSDLSHLDKTMQIFQFCSGIGTLALSVVPGAVADLTGSYLPAYGILLALAAVSLLVIQSTYRAGSQQEQEVPR